MPSRPKLIGVTGGIGSGKSTVCKIFETLGHKVYYADDRAKWLMHHNADLVEKIKALFGESAFQQGVLNRKLISEKAFKTPSILEKLNAVVHPAVGKDLLEWQQANENDKLLFYEAALVFETGSSKKMDEVVLVTAPEEVRIQRVLKRDPQRTRESIVKIMDQQLSDEDKESRADHIIKNDGTTSVIEQSMSIYSKLT